MGRFSGGRMEQVRTQEAKAGLTPMAERIADMRCGLGAGATEMVKGKTVPKILGSIKPKVSRSIRATPVNNVRKAGVAFIPFGA